jgi:hypothetical protein
MADPSSYPYSGVLKTRAGWHLNWILLQDKRTGMKKSEILRNQLNWRALPSSCFSMLVLNYLIISGEALPVPKEMDKVLNCMDCWGRGIDAEWYYIVLQRMAVWLNGAEALSEQFVLKHCIGIRVRLMLTRNFGNAPATEALFFHLEWLV